MIESLYTKYLLSLGLSVDKSENSFKREVALGKELYDKVSDHFPGGDGIPLFSYTVTDSGLSYNLTPQEYKAILEFGSVLLALEDYSNPDDVVYAKMYQAGVQVFPVIKKLNDVLVYLMNQSDLQWRVACLRYSDSGYKEYETLLETNLTLLKIGESWGFE